MKDLEKDVLTKIKFSSPSWDHKHEGFFYSRNDDGNIDGAATAKVV